MSKKFYCNFCQQEVQPEVYENVDSDIYHCPICNRPMYYENATGCLQLDQFSTMFFAEPNLLETPATLYQLKKSIHKLEDQICAITDIASKLLNKRDELMEYLPVGGTSND